MNPKEKAKELFETMSAQTYTYQPYAGAHYSTEEIGWEAGKKCALIMVNGILNILFQHHKIDYWKQVKKELELL
jgi:hypothetical protein